MDTEPPGAGAEVSDPEDSAPCHKCKQEVTRDDEACTCAVGARNVLGMRLLGGWVAGPKGSVSVPKIDCFTMRTSLQRWLL